MSNITKLQKELIMWIVFFLVTAFCGAFYIENTPNEHEGIIRLHVIANSDSKEDQALKLKVRDALLAELKEKKSLKDTRIYIKKNLGRIEKISEAVVKNNGFDYPARAELKVTFIPSKTYDDDLTLPAGNYEALNVTLGSGRGHNWWCVIYPQLCLIGNKSHKNGKKIKLKSKIREVMRKRSSSKSESFFISYG